LLGVHQEAPELPPRDPADGGSRLKRYANE
jgi:hypothetical protein